MVAKEVAIFKGHFMESFNPFQVQYCSESNNFSETDSILTLLSRQLATIDFICQSTDYIY